MLVGDDDLDAPLAGRREERGDGGLPRWVRGGIAEPQARDGPPVDANLERPPRERMGDLDDASGRDGLRVRVDRHRRRIGNGKGRHDR